MEPRFLVPLCFLGFTGFMLATYRLVRRCCSEWTKEDCVEFAFDKTNYLHACIGVSLVIYCFIEEPVQFTHFLRSHSSSMDQAASVTCGYLLIDLSSVLWYGIPPHYSEYFVFHVGILFCFSSYLLNQTGGVGCMVGLVGDLFAIVFQHQTELDRCFGLYQGYIHWLQLTHEWLVVFVMFTSRVVPCAYIVYLVARDPDWGHLDLVTEHVWVVFVQAAMMAFMFVMTLYFACLTVQDAMKASQKARYCRFPKQERQSRSRRPQSLTFSPSVNYEFRVEDTSDAPQDWTHVQDALLGVPGVNSALLTNRHAKVSTESAVSAASLIKAVRTKGFGLVLVHQSSVSVSPLSSATSRSGNLETPKETSPLLHPPLLRPPAPIHEAFSFP